VLTPSRKRFFSLSMALICLLCVFFGSYAQNAQSPNVDDFNQFTWRWVGPTTFSGRIAAVSVPRGQSLTYYALVASGGLWKTVDGGIHFEPIFERYGTLSMGWMAIAPSNQDVLYLGTGEPMHARASTHGNGVWKSTDAGKTWTNVGLAEKLFHPQGRGRLCESGHRLCRSGRQALRTTKWTASAASTRAPMAARPGPTSFRSRPGRSGLRHRSAQLKRHHRRSLQDVPAGLDLYGPLARQQSVLKRRTAARPGRS